MRFYTVNYKARGDEPRGLLNRGVFVDDLPRPVLACRLFGHKPVVDGTGQPGEHNGYVSRWVTCDRCGTRPEPQGILAPERWDIDEPYTGDYSNEYVPLHERTPGPFPGRHTWDLSGQILIGSSFPGFSAQLKVGNCASENALAGHLRLGRAFAIYWNTGELGRWWQRRLNPTGYESKIIDLTIGDRRLRWKLWIDRDRWDRNTPAWRDGSVRYGPLDLILGEQRYALEDIGEPVTTTLTLPHGDRYDITMQLQRRTRSRKRTRPRFDGWHIDWEARGGIPTKPGGRGEVVGAGVMLPDALDGEPVREMWVRAGLDAIEKQLTAMRDRYDYEGTNR